MDRGSSAALRRTGMFASILRIVVLLALAFPAATSVRAAGPWYVAPTGNDSNSCTSPATPCLTINGAIGKASPGDTIKVAIGTYTGSGDQVVSIAKDIILLGGWDAGFTAQSGRSTIDGQKTRGGIQAGEVTVVIDHFAIQNGYSSFGGGISTWSTNLTLSKSIVTQNVAGGDGGGINSRGTLTVNDTTISDNTGHANGGSGGGGGGGIMSFSGSITLNNSTISGNKLGGSFSGSAIDTFTAAVINNTTVSGNTGGTAINSDNNLTISSSTIAGNPMGGIHIGDWDTAVLRNTILAANTAAGGKDCAGSVLSHGYNLLGNDTGCTFSQAIGDLVGNATYPMDPQLGPLADHGGPTFTRPLAGSSPALNAGNPAAPGSGEDACLATDQRGVSRPVDGRCDIGAYEGSVMLVTSISRMDPSPTSAFNVRYTVTFSESVTGVDLLAPFSDFGLTTTGLMGAAITAVGGSGDTYQVTVNVGSGTGTVRLNVLDDDTILGLSGYPLGGGGPGNGGFTGPAYTIVNPRVISILRASPNPTSAFSVKFNVKFSEPVTGVDKTAPFSDFGLTTTGLTGPAIAGVTGTGSNYVVTVKTGLGNGTVQLKLLDDDSLLSKFGRPLGGSGVGNGNFTGPTYTVRKIPTLRSPVGTSTWNRTPTYQWTNNIPAVTQYSYQLWKGTTLVSTRTVLASRCGLTDCMDTPATRLLPATYKWRVRAAAAGIWLPFSAYKTFTVLGPKAGYWKASWTDFYVPADRVNVKSFSIYITVSGCGSYKITHTALAPIIDREFSFGGSFYARGTFAITGISANGMAGLSYFPIPGCGYVSGGPFPWTATWRSASLPVPGAALELLPLPGAEGTFPGPFIIEPVQP